MTPTIEIHVSGPDWGDRNIIPVQIAQELYKRFPDHEVRYFVYDPPAEATPGVFTVEVHYPNGHIEKGQFVRNWAATKNAIA